MSKPCSNNSLECTLSIIGDKWTALILNNLNGEPLCFGQLERSLDGISPRTLSQRLDKLEESDIISRNLYCERPPRFNYSLTQKGKELQEVISEMAAWGTRHA